ncbi:MAG TPA: hypothetical protein PKX38_09660, partial [Alphaproteobacteria bacterium]|nr:hypothetical protein [Alphaproteobacteria bacterium]
SSRSGGGDAGNETNLISSAQITQYPSSVRTSIIRMMVSNNVTASELEFNAPSDFASCTSSNTRCVFHPAGGGATFVPAPVDVVTGTSPQPWVFNGENEVDLVGTTVGGDNPSSSTAEIIAILPNVKEAICERINSELGIASVPVETALDVTTQKVNGVTLVSGGAGGTIGEGSVLSGQAFGCFQQPANTYYYYHVLIEQ